jgi:hypothetical protein
MIAKITKQLKPNSHMNSTLVLLENGYKDTLCTAMCLSTDYPRLLQQERIPVNVECIDETLAKIFYPDAYLNMVKADPIFCIGVWIESLFKGEKDYTVDGNTLYTPHYIIDYANEKLTVTVGIGCCAIELSSLLLLIKDRVGDDIELEVNGTVKFCHSSEN